MPAFCPDSIFGLGATTVSAVRSVVDSVVNNCLSIFGLGATAVSAVRSDVDSVLIRL